MDTARHCRSRRPGRHDDRCELRVACLATPLPMPDVDFACTRLPLGDGLLVRDLAGPAALKAGLDGRREDGHSLVGSHVSALLPPPEVVPPMPGPFAQSVARVEWLAPPNLSGDCGTAFLFCQFARGVLTRYGQWPGHGEDDDGSASSKDAPSTAQPCGLFAWDAEIGGDLRSELEETRVAEGTRFTSLAVQHQGDAIFGRTLVPAAWSGRATACVRIGAPRVSLCSLCPPSIVFQPQPLMVRCRSRRTAGFLRFA